MRSCASAAACSALAAVVLAPAAGAATVDAPRAAHLTIAGLDERAAIQPAGDFNGDGRDDLVVGLPHEGANGRPRSGSAFVVFGRRARAAVSLRRLGDGGLRIDGRPAVVPVEDELGVIGEGAGRGVAGIGDVNGDGLDDVAVGAPRASHDENRLLSGSVYVVYGRREPGTLDLAALGDGGLRIDGPRPFDDFGRTLAGLPGREPSVAIGADQRVHLVRATPPPGSVVDLAAPVPGAFLVTGYDRGDFNPFYAGDTMRTLAYAGDMDRDGRGDLLVGQGSTDVEGVAPDESPYESSAFVVFGGADAGLPGVGARGLRIDGVAGPVALLGDVLGDARPEVVAAGRLRRGRFALLGARDAALLVGRGPGRVDLARLGRSVRRVPGRSGGWGIAAVGDLDGDRRADIAFGTGGERARNRVLVVSSRSAGRRRARPLAVLTGSKGRGVGFRLAAAGDVDGDGRGDLLVGGSSRVAVVTARRLGR